VSPSHELLADPSDPGLRDVRLAGDECTVTTELVERFTRAHSVGDFNRARLDLQRLGTPTEVRELQELRGRLPDHVADWLTRLHDYCFWEESEVQNYSPHVGDSRSALFRSDGDPGDKELVIGFSGAAGNLYQPTPVVLQKLGGSPVDLLLLRDDDRSRYGVDHAGCDRFLELIDTIAPVAAQYRSVLTIGTSMGGFPALLAGRSLGARRSVSLGGHADPCPPPGISSVIRDLPGSGPDDVACIFGAGNSRDRAGAVAQATYFRDAALFAIQGVTEHNVSHAAFRQGSLKGLFELITARTDLTRALGAPSESDGTRTLSLRSSCSPPAWVDQDAAGPVWAAQAVLVPTWAKRITRRLRVPRSFAGLVSRAAYRRFGIIVRLRSR
jgi:hypothetical protein